jgi:signal transduction histidine kinase
VRPRLVSLALAAAFTCLLAHAAHTTLGLGGETFDPLFNDWLYNGILAAAAILCAVRGLLIRAERVVWLVIAGAIASWTIGDVYWTIELSDRNPIPYPSIADAFYLAFYPALYVGIALLVRSRVSRFRTSIWLDGALAALGTAALGAAVLYPAIKDSTGGDVATVATNLAYPLGDVLLLSIVVGVLALTGWRPDRCWLILAGGLACEGLADSVYLYAEATGSYVEGGWIDSFWLVGLLLMAVAAWDCAPKRKLVDLRGIRLIIAPSLFALAALALLAYGTFASLNRLALGLATATLFVVLLRMIMTFRENTTLIAAAEDAARAKSDFLANMSHELRTPLTSIIGYSEMMLDPEEEVDPSERGQFAKRIFTSGHHLKGLINDLLDLTKVEAGMMNFQPEKVHVGELVEEVEGTMRVLASNNRIELRTSIATGLGEVVTDRAKLKQVLLNYLSNAVKFTPPGGRVTLVVEPYGGGNFRLTVEDTGIGISEEDQERLFKEFHQIDLRAPKERQGTGLGLALVKRIVEAQGGTVGVHSVPGRGSIFFAVLPTLTTIDTESPPDIPAAADPEIGGPASTPALADVVRRSGGQKLAH